MKPARAVVERFVELYNARDLPGLLQLMGDGGTIELYGSHREIGRAGFERERGWFYHNFHNFDGTPSTLRCTVASFRDEPIMLVMNVQNGEEVMASLMRTRGGGRTRPTAARLRDVPGRRARGRRGARSEARQRLRLPLPVRSVGRRVGEE